MKVLERNVMRLVAVQHLRSAHGIKTKNWNKNKANSCKLPANSSTKVFGVPLESLPVYNMECGHVPSFLVEACMKLQAHVDTEGLFRKSGSVVRLKALRAKLDEGEECLSTALPCDVAGLVKQFFRELPEPALPTELHEAFVKAQQLPTAQDRTSATMLLSCVLPDRNLSVLRHFFEFLQNVSKRSAENKMDSNNLSVILAPNLLHSGDGTEKMNANTEKRLKLQAAVVQCFIENAHSLGVLPRFLEEKVPAMMGCESVLSPSRDETEELDVNAGTKRRQRRSFGVFSSATPVISTPTKRKLPLESGQSFGFSNKKRRSVKKTLGIELLPNSLFSGTSTPGSAYSASGVLDSSQNTLWSAGGSRQQSATSARRKSRLGSRHAVSRAESGRAGCFSPKVAKKEGQRKSLRQRFSLGKSHKDAGSESIGWRLATQETTAGFSFTKETEFSPAVLRRSPEPKSAKYMSRSADDLLTPVCEASGRRTSWSAADTPMNVCLKKPSEPPAASGRPKTLCCVSSAASLDGDSSVPDAQTLSGPTLPRVKTPPESAGDSPAAVTPGGVRLPPRADADASVFPAQSSLLAGESNVTFGQLEIAALSPLHIDSVVLESVTCSPATAAPACSSVVGDDGEEGAEQGSCSRLIDALDIQSPAHFQLGVSSGLQSTPYKPELCRELGASGVAADLGAVHEEQQPQKPRVADHIQHFNKLTLRSPRGAKAQHIRSPLRFQRTPVRQAVRRINSLMGDCRRPAPPVESGLAPHSTVTRKKPPPVPPKTTSTLARRPKALGDVTNKVQAKPRGDRGATDPPGAPKAAETLHYRGSPRNPLNPGRLLSATKPVDL